MMIVFHVDDAELLATKCNMKEGPSSSLCYGIGPSRTIIRAYCENHGLCMQKKLICRNQVFQVDLGLLSLELAP